MMEDKNREYSISVICVYNDKQRMNEQLKKTLSDQACTYDFVPVNNVNNQFKSAAEALNFGALKAKGDILVFAHQDIIFKTKVVLPVEPWPTKATVRIFSTGY